jgi:hypothetical protein
VPTTITLSDEQVESIRDALAPPYDLDRVVDRLTAVVEALDASHHDDYGTRIYAIDTDRPTAFDHACGHPHLLYIHGRLHGDSCNCFERSELQ